MKRQAFLMIVITAILGWIGIARATAIMNVLYDRYDLYTSVVWGSSNDYVDLPTGIPVGQVDSGHSTGSIFDEIHNNHYMVGAYAWSNRAFAHASIEFGFHEYDSSLSVVTSTYLDDDMTGAWWNEHTGDVKSQWTVCFDIYGGSAGIDIGGLMFNLPNFITSGVELLDLTTNLEYTFTLYDHLTLQDGHRYLFTQFSGQGPQGYELQAVTAVSFHDILLRVPEPSSLLLMESGLLGCLLLMRRRNKKR